MIDLDGTEAVAPDPDVQATEPEVDVEKETLRRDLEAARIDLETTRGTLTAVTTERDGLLLNQLRETVARENQVPVKFLIGNDRAKLEASADALKEFKRSRAVPTGPLRPTRRGTALFAPSAYMPPSESVKERAANALADIRPER